MKNISKIVDIEDPVEPDVTLEEDDKSLVIQYSNVKNVTLKLQQIHFE